jgi:DNA polymerase
MQPNLAILDLDLETRSFCDLPRCGAWRYSQDKTTEVLCLQGLLDGVKVSARFEGGTYPIPPAISAMLPHLIVVAHNCEFEQAMWLNVLHWPEPVGWIDTMALAASFALPQSLDGCATALGLGQKDAVGAKTMLRLCKPGRNGEYPHITADDWSALLSYCFHDVELEAGILAELGRLSTQEGAVWAAHNAINRRGIPIDRDLCERAVRLMASVVAQEGHKVAAATGGAVSGADLRRVAHLLDWMAGRGVDLDDLRASTVERALRRKTLPADVRAVLEARQRISKSSTSKLEAMLDAVGDDGRVRGCFNYHGATTGRWAGRLFQPQNLPKPSSAVDTAAAVAAILAEDPAALIAAGAGDPEDAIVAAVRPAICPGPGKALIVVDYASIESRAALWLADDQEHLDMYRTGADLYCLMASRIYGRTITKADKAERQVGKVAVLGCGYGMGVGRFLQFCKDVMDIDLAASGTTAEAVIAAYRAEFSSLAAKPNWREGTTGGLWSRLGACAMGTVETGRSVECGPLSFRLDSAGCLRLILPSGRPLIYWKPRIEEEEREWEGRKYLSRSVVYDDISRREAAPVRAWGGLWLENACQALCRDLMATAIVAAEAAGLHVVMHCHDEIVCEVPAETASADLKRLEAIMTAPPTWASGFPVAVEGFVTRRYGKEPLV